MRQHYLDNLRIIVILLLFPLHTFMIWNNYGAGFYIWAGENNLLSSLIILVNPWIMALLFVIAGISTRYSLAKRNTKQFLKERFSKLLIPFIGCLLLLIPIQTFYARKFFFAYDGSIIEHYQYFFTHVTDLSGNDGCFTPGHLWFILFLFIISLLAILIIKYLPYEKVSAKLAKINLFGIILLFIPIWLMSYIGAFGVYSFGRYFALYLLGYYLLSNEQIVEKLLAKKGIILSLFCLSQFALAIAYYFFAYYGDLAINFVGWLGVLACLIVGKLFFNQENHITRYFKKSSFSIYLLHLTILVVISYYAITLLNNMPLQIGIILCGSFMITILAYEIIRRIPFLKSIIGVRS